MTLPTQNQLAWKISITLLHFLAFSSTLVRIGHRWRTRRAWWDDYIVVIPWCFDIIYIVTMWAKYKNHDISWDIPDPSGFIYSAWFDSFLYFSEIWFSRISMTLSVARIFLPGHPYRIWAFGFVVVLFLLYLASLLIATFSCRGTPWWDLNFNNCVSTPSGADVGTIVGVTVDFAADIVLVAAPLIMFWKIDFPRQERVLVLVLFSSSVLTMIASMLYCTIWYAASRLGPDSRLLFEMMAQLQATVSLLVCNSLVVAMLLYRKLRGCEDIIQARIRRRRVAEEDKITTSEFPQSAEDTDRSVTTAPSYTVIPVSSTSVPSSLNSSQQQYSFLSTGLSSSDANTSTHSNPYRSHSQTLNSHTS
ncbi:hypothetical protein CPB84DRAFT_1823099 [Gymnopilus junonius]|uniref:Rhodopsin domain-containing protein n=1 Tax=Gymnopilus junonius TaxID=109634 RepID=A0A9P5NV90_GYMJU|nr:hypothetical protein CPB84DRAFT_1823099 [Gymnopilus junonius]